MVKSNQKEEQITVTNEPNSSSSCKYKGVRKRKWGKYVSEIRLPNSRERIWLGSYDTAQKAARAFDAAQFCLRGKNAKFNFPDNPPDILNGGSMTRGEIQVAAAQFARSGPGPGPSESDRVEALDQSNCSDSFSSGGEVVLSRCVESPSCASVSNLVEGEVTDLPLEDSFYDQFLGLGTEGNSVDDFGVFSGFDEFGGDYYVPPLASVDYWPDNSEELYSQSTSLWNF